MKKQCPRKRPHPPHNWIWENRTPVLGVVRVENSCDGVEEGQR